MLPVRFKSTKKFYETQDLLVLFTYGGWEMCKECVLDAQLDRGKTCLETGAYVANLRGCAQCGDRAFPRTTDRERMEDDATGDEEVGFTHTCAECGHEIARHRWTFQLRASVQHYEMQCRLCGLGADERDLEARNERELL